MPSTFQNYIQGGPEPVQELPQPKDDVDPMIWELTFPDMARKHIFNYIKDRLGAGDPVRETFSIDQVYLVWFNYVLGNWKAMLGTELGDRAYYEVTYNAAKRETYVDEYKKFNHVGLPDSAPL